MYTNLWPAASDPKPLITVPPDELTKTIQLHRRVKANQPSALPAIDRPAQQPKMSTLARISKEDVPPGFEDWLAAFNYSGRMIQVIQVVAAAYIYEQWKKAGLVRGDPNFNRFISESTMKEKSIPFKKSANRTIVKQRGDGAFEIWIAFNLAYKFYNVDLDLNRSHEHGRNFYSLFSSGDDMNEFVAPEKAVAWFEKAFGESVWDIDQGSFCDLDLSVDLLSEENSNISLEILNKALAEQYKDRLLPNTDPDGFVGYMLKNFFQKGRLISQAGSNLTKRETLRSLADWHKLSMDEKIESGVETEVGAKLKLLQSRQATYMFYAHLLLDAPSAKFIVSDAANSLEAEPTAPKIGQYVSACLHDLGKLKERRNGPAKIPRHFVSFSALESNNRQLKTPSTGRVNEYNLAVDSNGNFYYIPKINRVMEFETEVEESGEWINESTWTADSPWAGESEGKRKIKNQIIWNDESSGVLSYFLDGEQRILDLNKIVPASDPQIYRFLTSPIMGGSDHSPDGVVGAMLDYLNPTIKVARLKDAIDQIEIDSRDFKALLNPKTETPVGGIQFVNLNWNYNVDKNGDMLRKAIADHVRVYGIGSYIREVGHTISRIVELTEGDVYSEAFRKAIEANPDYNWINTISLDKLTLLDLGENSACRFLRPIGKLLDLVSKEIAGDPIGFVQDFGRKSVDETLASIAFATIWQNYRKKLPKLEKTYAKFRESIELVDKKQDWTPPKTPLVTKNYKLFPHQGGVLQQLERNPKLVLMHVDAGGGKTQLALYKILQLLDQGEVKKPLIISPNNLKANYVNDANFMTNGKLNVFPIDTHSLKDYYKTYDRLARAIEEAPPNTVFVTDDDWLKGVPTTISYGTRTLERSINNDFLQKLSFDAIFLDESHRGKNEDSIRTDNIQRLFSNPQVKYKYLMSGTVVSNELNDLVSQVSMLDSTLLGEKDEFDKKYGMQFLSSGKVTQWKPSAAKDVKKLLRENICLIESTRKDWESLLPEAIHEFHFVQLTPTQMKIYRDLGLSQTEEMMTDPKLQKVLADGDDKAIESAMYPWLQKLERFVSAPGKFDLFEALGLEGGEVLKGDDLISPKVKKAIELCEKHLKDNKKGKILVFTSYIASAEAVYELMPTELQRQTIPYRAQGGITQIGTFLHNDKYRILVGVEKSLNTGHNFVNTSRIIRMESVYTPGELEQGESRIFRPTKQKEITHKYLDWILGEKTVDMLKGGRLIAKAVDRAKLSDDQEYQVLPSLPRLPLDRTSLLAQLTKENIKPYRDAYGKMHEITKEVYKAHRENPATLKDEFLVPTKSDLPGSKLIRQLPYIENGQLPLQGTGLEDKLVSAEVYASEFTEYFSSMEMPMKDLRVHSEYGEGIVVKSETNGKQTPNVQILFDNGMKKTISRTRVFIFTDQENIKSTQVNVKEAVRKVTKFPNTPPSDLDQPSSLKDELEEIDEAISDINEDVPDAESYVSSEVFMLTAMGLNNQVALEVNLGVENAPENTTLEVEGFEFSKQHAEGMIRDRTIMGKLYDKIKTFTEENDFVLQPHVVTMLENAKNAWDRSRKAALILKLLDMETMRKNTIFRQRQRRNDELYLSFVIKEGVFYIQVILNSAGRQFVRKKIAGFNWKVSEGDWVVRHRTKKDALDFVRELSHKYLISNLDEVVEQINTLKLVKS